MKQRQHIFQSWAIEVVTVLLASTISFPVSDALGMQLSTLPFIMVACYVALKLIYHLCLSLSAHIISLTSLFCHKPTKSNRQTKDDSTLATAISMVGNDDIQMKRIELFHYEYLHEERQYLQQKEKEEDEKLQAVLQYTRNTFRQFDFSEEEIFQISECVRYFVTNRQALSVNIHIKRRTAGILPFNITSVGMSQHNLLCRHSTNGLPIPPLKQLGRIYAQQLGNIRLK